MISLTILSVICVVAGRYIWHITGHGKWPFD